MTRHGEEARAFEPAYREEHMARADRVLAIGVAVIGLGILVATLAEATGSPLFPGFHFGTIAVGIVELALGATYFIRARASSENERFSARALKRIALMFFALGAIVIAISLFSNFRGMT